MVHSWMPRPRTLLGTQQALNTLLMNKRMDEGRKEGKNE